MLVTTEESDWKELQANVENPSVEVHTKSVHSVEVMLC